MGMMMMMKNCMNEACRRTTSSSDWRPGWALKSGGFASLCSDCGSAYENSVFCESFHLKESGWRECRKCLKHLHCGCIASRYLYEFMDCGGIVCASCAKRKEVHPIQVLSAIPDGMFFTGGGARNVRPFTAENRIGDPKFLQLNNSMKVDSIASALEQMMKREGLGLKIGESSKNMMPNPSLQCSSSAFVQPDNSRPKQVVDNISNPSNGSSRHGQSEHNPLTSPPKPNPIAGLEAANQGTASQIPVARPPADGRGRNQLLPRYWPRISDQELQQLSGSLKSNVTPLFEKILSASDAGRIGRLVLPKACAEKYFPTINQSEGIPIQIQDTTGKEWTFQFRFWPNNNSRMYVLEGITPCIQNMQLRAGDSVLFSRIDPGGQLLLGCRKANNNVDMQDAETPGVSNGDKALEASFPGVPEYQLLNGGRVSGDLSENEMSRNIKNKRLHMHNDDAAELRVTWEEAQELLRPSPTSDRSVVMVEGHEFEEFQEPPVFGKRTLFVTESSGEQQQLVQCESCSKWRSVPSKALIPANWTCSDNTWDSNRCSCSAVEDINPTDLECFRVNCKNPDSEREKISGLDALANAAVLGGDEVRERTRHPRHRLGCSCIVCIQPPSGKGKHDPSCKCNVCLTVKRRFKTLSMRKKQRQSERSARERECTNTNSSATTSTNTNTNTNGNNVGTPRDKPVDSDKQQDDLVGRCVPLLNATTEHGNFNRTEADKVVKKGQLDLNCHPPDHNDEEDEVNVAPLETGN